MTPQPDLDLGKLRDLLVLLEEFGVRQFVFGGLQLFLPEASGVSPQIQVDLTPTPTPEPRHQAGPAKLWDEPALWPGKRMGFDGSLK